MGPEDGDTVLLRAHSGSSGPGVGWGYSLGLAFRARPAHRGDSQGSGLLFSLVGKMSLA